MVWQSLQLYFSNARFPATTRSSSLSAWVSASKLWWVSYVAARNRASELSVPIQKMALASLSLMGAPSCGGENRPNTSRGRRHSRSRAVLESGEFPERQPRGRPPLTHLSVEWPTIHG